MPMMDKSAWIISIVSSLLLIVHLLLQMRYGALEDGLDAVALGLIAIGLSPLIARVIESLEIGGLKMRFVQAQLDKQEREIEAISFMLTHYLPFWELHHLKALADGAEFIVDPDYHPEFLEQELRHLREIGLIALRSDKTIMEMCRSPGKKNLHDYVYITDRGRSYLRLRAEMMNVTTAAPPDSSMTTGT